MPRRAKIVLVAVVLVAGFLVAWQFRKSPAVQSAANSTADTQTRTEAAQKPVLQLQNTAPPLDLSAMPAQQTAPTADPASRFTTASPDAAPTPRADSAVSAIPSPSRPDSEKLADVSPDHTAASAAKKPAEATVPELPPNFSGADRPNRTSANDLHSDPSSSDATAQTHKIVDGDSLQSLAERYLGSANRSGEIFACNRDVLSDPDLLPIGVRLRIPTCPARSASATNPPPGTTPDATPDATFQAAAPLIAPVPTKVAEKSANSAPLLDIGVPTLSPLPPLGEQTGSPSRIYIVQSGDTLPGIAQKLYGDSGRTEALLHANRDQLRSEQDLRPGMMLEAR